MAGDDFSESWTLGLERTGANEITLHEPLVIAEPTVIKDTIFTAGPELAGKTMIEIPSSIGANRLQGVRLKRVTLNCNGIAAAGLAAIDLDYSEFVDFKVIAPLQTAIYLAGYKFAMQHVEFKRLDIWCQDGASGLILDGDTTNNANVSFCDFKESYIHTEAGRALEIRDADTCLFENLILESVSGYSVLCAERGNNTWINVDCEKGNVHFSHPEREHFVSWSTLNGGNVPK